MPSWPESNSEIKSVASSSIKTRKEVWSLDLKIRRSLKTSQMNWELSLEHQPRTSRSWPLDLSNSVRPWLWQEMELTILGHFILLRLDLLWEVAARPWSNPQILFLQTTTSSLASRQWCGEEISTKIWAGSCSSKWRSTSRPWQLFQLAFSYLECRHLALLNFFGSMWLWTSALSLLWLLNHHKLKFWRINTEEKVRSWLLLFGDKSLACSSSTWPLLCLSCFLELLLLDCQVMTNICELTSLESDVHPLMRAKNA